MESASAFPPSRPAEARAERAPATLEGWYVLHQLFRLDWARFKALGESEAAAACEGLARELEGWADLGEGGWSGLYRMVGGGVDLMLLHLRPDLESLTEASHGVSLSGIADHLHLDHEYLSVVELGLYQLTAELVQRLGDEADDPERWQAALAEVLDEQRRLAYVGRRLRPTQPEEMPYVCYYPMNKRRAPGQNWYALPLAERTELMHEHGSVGRRYAGRISQIISGSIGLADWEWAVTLFAGDPLDFKGVVTEMRYDRASADFAEFGRFFVGKRMPPDRLVALHRP